MWYVEYLLLHSTEIRAESDLESDYYNDLLVVEKEIDTLRQKNIIDEKELYVLEKVCDSRSFRSLEEEGIKESENLFKKICDRISYSLGGIFTDDGYLEYLQNRYNLTEEELETISCYMKSIYRHKILKKPYEEIK